MPPHMRARRFDSFAPAAPESLVIAPVNTTKRNDAPDGGRGVRLTGSKAFK